MLCELVQKLYKVSNDVLNRNNLDCMMFCQHEVSVCMKYMNCVCWYLVPANPLWKHLLDTPLQEVYENNEAGVARTLDFPCVWSKLSLKEQ